MTSYYSDSQDKNHATKEEPKDFGKGQSGIYRRWMREIEQSNVDHIDFLEKSRKVMRRYFGDDIIESRHRKRFNILWSNIQVMMPTLYNKAPEPHIIRAFRDDENMAGIAAELLERNLVQVIETQNTDRIFDRVIQDFLITGRGVIWVRYEPKIVEAQSPEQVPYLSNESVMFDYVHWSDFRHNAARDWKEVRWVARRVHMTKDEMKKRFGSVGGEVGMDVRAAPKQDYEKKPKVFQTAIVWEIWDKQSQKVYWLSPGLPDKLLDMSSPICKYQDFFPCPEPLTATIKSDSIIPRPDYFYYQNQAEEIDQLTMRIDLLTDALKVMGFYNSEFKEPLGRILEAPENTMVPVDVYAAASERGGMKGQIEYFPIQEVAATLRNLVELRERVKSDAYEISGISDILRGETKSSETATAQRLKTQFGSIRLQKKRDEINRLIRQVYHLASETISQKFLPETIIFNAVGYSQEIQPQQAMAAIGILKNDYVRDIFLDVETEATDNEPEERKERIEFITASVQALQQIVALKNVAPPLTSVAARLIMFGMQGFKTSRRLESQMKQSLDSMIQHSMQPSGPDRLEKRDVMQAELKSRELDIKEQEVAGKLGIEMDKNEIKSSENMVKTSQLLSMEAQDVLAESAQMQMEGEVPE